MATQARRPKIQIGGKVVRVSKRDANSRRASVNRRKAASKGSGRGRTSGT
jgi:hypothetical protein